MEKLIFKIITPAGVSFETEADFIKLPCVSGEVGVLPNHTPTLTKLDIGKIRVEHGNGKIDRFFVSEGIAQIQPDKVLILTDNILHASDIDVEKAIEEEKVIRKQMSSSDEKAKCEKTKKKLKRATAQIFVHSTQFKQASH
jgi:F-type H+-transporting ATPase subunit epsilon